MKTRWCIIIVTLIASINLAQGYNPEKIQIGEIYYRLNEDYKTAIVTSSITKLTLAESQSYYGTIKIPSAIYYEGDIYNVVEIDYRAFEYSHISEVIIPNSITQIGDYAFNGCRELETVVLPEKLRRIERETFGGCRSLVSIQIGDNVQYIGESAFRNCCKIETLYIPKTVKKIEYNAFYGVNNIVYNGNAEGAPWEANNINKIADGYLIYSDKTKTILGSCSPSVSGKIQVPDGVTRISANAFKGCTGITSITLPNSLKYIEYGAFMRCTKLQYLTIPESVETIEDEVFRGCKNLTLRIPEKFREKVETLDYFEVIYY